MIDNKFHKRLTIFVLPVITLMFFISASNHFNYTPDDTYIYLQFAKNIINGEGFSFNAGEPTYGFTSPIWLFINVLGGSLGINLYQWTKVVDLFFASVSIIIFYLVCFEVIRDIAVSLIASLVFSQNIWLIRWAGTGMESSLSVFLMLVTFLLYLRNKYYLSSILAALLTLVRPEACCLFVLIIIDLFINSTNRKRAILQLIYMSMFFLTPIIFWMILAYCTFGTIVPNTIKAKSSLDISLLDSLNETTNALKIILTSDGIATTILIVSIVLVIINIQKKGITFISNDEKYYLFRQSFVSLCWLVFLPLLYGLMRVNVVSRYLLIATPLITIFSFLFLYKLISSSRYNSFRYAGAVLHAGLIIIQSQTVYQNIVKPGIESFEFGMKTCLIPIGQWLKANAKQNEIVLASDIGAIGYYSDKKICDAAGLATPQMIPISKAGFSIKQIIDDEIYKKYCNADYIVHRSNKPEELKRNPHLIPLFIKPFYQMGLFKKQVQYYTLYKVIKETNQ